VRAGLKQPQGLSRGRWLKGLTLLGAAVVTGCAAPASPGCTDGARALLDERLYMGRATPQGEVTNEAWQAFLDSEVTPRFQQEAVLRVQVWACVSF
jgi:hypothetical protein